MTNKMPFLSIVVPVYNVEEYLERCLDSVISQSFIDWEMIIVDDCSPDNSQQIIRRYQTQDSRIRCILNEKNRGLGGARNLGIYHSRGEYVLFIDSDDFISDECALEQLCGIASGNNLDVIDTPYRVIKDGVEVNRLPKKFNALNDKVYTGTDYMEHIQVLPIVAWNKLYKRVLLQENNILFKERKYEDICFTLEVMYKARRVQNTSSPFYNYIIREGSIMTSKVGRSSIDDAMELCYDLERLYECTNQNTQIEKSFFYGFIGLQKLLSEYDSKEHRREVSIRLKSLHSKYRWAILKADKLGLIQKLSLFISPKLTLFIIKKSKK
jgi:glycosyltransferase involved in cell wall biosynthesis